MVQKAVRSEASSPNSLGPKQNWPEVRGEECRPRTVLSWLLAKWVVGESEETGRRTLSSHEPENPEEKESALSWESGNRNGRFSSRPSTGGRSGAVLAVSYERANSNISGLPTSGPLRRLSGRLGDWLGRGGRHSPARGSTRQPRYRFGLGQSSSGGRRRAPMVTGRLRPGPGGSGGWCIKPGQVCWIASVCCCTAENCWAVSLQALDGRRGRFLQVAAFRGHRCTAIALSTWGIPSYPLATPPLRLVRMEEADERLLAVKGAIHDFVSSSCTSGKKGTEAWRGWDWAVWWPPVQCSRLPGQAWPSALGPVRRWRQHPRGAAPPHLHPQRTWAHPPMLRSTSYLQMVHRMKCWAPRGADQRNHPGTGLDVRCVRSKRSVGACPGGEALTVTLRSPRAQAGDPLLAERPARVAAEGANPFIKERRDCNEIMLIRPQTHPRTHLQRVGSPDTEDNDRVRHQQTWNDRNQKNTDETASWKRRDSPWSALLEFALLVEVPRGIADERDSADRTFTPTRNK